VPPAPPRLSDFIDRLNAALDGRYVIDREIGQGGMATVYLARDVKHNRNVALKVLKPELAAVVGAERFLAEIETTANLQHPHILPLFDSGEAGGFLFFVMPFVQGETLADRIAREKQLPVDEALGIATSVASALQHAHDRGVIHRDIKPGNILLQDGQPVVGDFGIALAVGAAGGARLTETGLSVGTPYYMSPEQATGDQVVGPASDTYALACVLYEMLTGEPPYPGNTAQAVLGKIIQGLPVSATAIRRSVPPNVDAAIRKALEKIPADRFTGAQAFAKALADPGFRHGDELAPPVAQTRRLRRVAIAGWTTAAAAIGALIVGVARPAAEPVRRVERFAVPFLEGQEPQFLGPAGYDLSPDGSMLVYRHVVDGSPVLMVRRWDDLTATPIRETTNAFDPAVSPDGRELAFERDGQIRVLAFAGGPVRTLTAGTVPEWGPDGWIYASTDSGTVRVPATGGALQTLTRMVEGETFHLVYDVLPDGGAALLMVNVSGNRWEVRTLDLGTLEMETLVEGQGPRYSPTGHLLYSADDGTGTLMAARFDARRRKLAGTPIAVMDGVGFWSLADDGKLFYTTGAASGGAGPTLQFIWVDRSGNATPVDPTWTFSRGTDANLRWSISPDGSMVALREFTAEGYDIWIKRLDTGPRSRLTFAGGMEKMPVWVPGTRDVTFLSDRNGNHDVWRRPADGTRAEELLVDLEQDIATVDWSPDGEWLFLRTSAGTATTAARNILMVRPGSGEEPIPLFSSDYRELNPAVSPDGRWIAYASDETGRYEIYVRPFPDVSAGRWQVSIGGGRSPAWAHSGREIFFQSPNDEMMVADVEAGTSFDSGTPRVLFPASPQWATGNLNGVYFAVHPDDERFLVATSSVGGAESQREGGPPPTVLVNNFFEELKARVPE
jgi:eukaryotic-like serine/threonine-protein kinase